jgi:hypothetical protein
VPFDFYKSIEVKTGGYPAEFGRATGGVINAVTKSGSNDFKFAVHGNFEPDACAKIRRTHLIAQPPRKRDRSKSGTFEVSGPIIKDHLFFYGLNQQPDRTTRRRPSRRTASLTPSTSRQRPVLRRQAGRLHHRPSAPRIHLFRHQPKRKRDAYALQPVADRHHGPAAAAQTLYQGGENYVGRYTGTFTDWLTLSAAYGRSEVDNASVGNLASESPNVVRLAQHDQSRSAQKSPRRPSRSSPNANSTAPTPTSTSSCSASTTCAAATTVKTRLLTETTVRNGGYQLHLHTLDGHRTSALGGFSRPVRTMWNCVSSRPAAASTASTRRCTSRTPGTSPTADPEPGRASGQVLGGRPERHHVSRRSTTKSVRALGFTYDVFGDRVDKVYGSFGRTFVPVASNTAFRAASPAIDISQFFLPAGGGLTFGALDPVTGLPVGGLGAQVIGTAANHGTLVQCAGRRWFDRSGRLLRLRHPQQRHVRRIRTRSPRIT